MSTTEREIIVGIDLGTTFSLVAYADERGPQVIRDERGDARLPSVVHVEPRPDGPPKITVGWEAREHLIERPETTVYSVKRLMGRSIRDVEGERPYLGYKVVPGPRDTVRIQIGDQLFSPEQVSSWILAALKQRAERHLGRPVSKAVITVPAYFDDAQRQATRDAGQAAGLEVVRIINEPTAAALAYGIGVRQMAGEVDGGQPPSAVNLQNSQGSVASGLRARREPADPSRQTGTSDATDTKGATPGTVPLPTPKCTEQRGPADVNPSDLVAVYDLGGGTFDISILRIEQGVFQVLATAGDTHLGGDDFDRAIIDLVAGEVEEQFGIRIESPTIQQTLRKFAEAVKIRLSEADEATLELDLGQGRVYRRVITRDEFEQRTRGLLERTLELCGRALDDAGLTPEQIGQIVLVGGSTRMPQVRAGVERFFGRKPYVGLNPDEVVAIGAAIQASILAGHKLDMLLLDVIPLSLGIETLGGAMSKLILRNTTIPCRETEMFTTFVDGQTAIRFTVLQGERELAQDCRKLGEFELRGIPPMPAGMPKIEVEFLVDANGILNVSARELRSGRQAGIQVVPSYGLTREEVERMTRESIEFARQDIDAHRRIDLVNQVQFDTHKAEQTLEKYGHLLDETERKRIEAEIRRLREMAETADDLDALHEALDRFGKSTLHLAELAIRETLREQQQALSSTTTDTHEGA